MYFSCTLSRLASRECSALLFTAVSLPPATFCRRMRSQSNSTVRLFTPGISWSSWSRDRHVDHGNGHHKRHQEDTRGCRAGTISLLLLRWLEDGGDREESEYSLVLTYNAHFGREHQGHSDGESDEVVTHQITHSTDHLLPCSPDNTSCHTLWRWKAEKSKKSVLLYFAQHPPESIT